MKNGQKLKLGDAMSPQEISKRYKRQSLGMPVTPQNRHLADYSDHATIYMMSLWKCTTKRLVHVQHARDAG
jgi:hypothetical protein